MERNTDSGDTPIEGLRAPEAGMRTRPPSPATVKDAQSSTREIAQAMRF